MPAKPLSFDIQKQIYELSQKGLSQRQIGKKLGIHDTSVLRYKDSPPVLSNKKEADFQWREWSEHAERTQELYRRASQTQQHAKIELGSGKSPVVLLPFSDQHIGSRGTTYKEFRRLTEEILETKNLYIALLGDMTEFAIKLRSVAEVCAQIFGPDKQIQFMEDWFGEIKHKVACEHGKTMKPREARSRSDLVLLNTWSGKTVFILMELGMVTFM